MKNLSILLSTGWRFKLCSAMTLYSLCVYCATMPLVVNVARFMADLHYQAQDFDSKMYVELVGPILVPYCLIPLSSWWDAPLFPAYLDKWREFQVTVYLILVHPIQLLIGCAYVPRIPRQVERISYDCFKTKLERLYFSCASFVSHTT